MSTAKKYDAIVLGGGAAGLMCALTAGQRGKRVLVLEVSNKIGKKILMSGGGRCNFTNLHVQPENFICRNPHFVKSALSQYTQWDFISMVAKHEIGYHEKSLGQLFCNNSAKDIVKMLLDECEAAGVKILTKCETLTAEKDDGDEDVGYAVTTSQGRFHAQSLVVATGGLSIPTLGGATGLGYHLAEQFGLQLHPTQASLVPLTLTGKWHELGTELSGLSLRVTANVASQGFQEDMLFTHRGLSGPAILQLSNYWQVGESIEIDLAPMADLAKEFQKAKNTTPSARLSSLMSRYWPKSLISALQMQWWQDKPLHEFKNQELVQIAQQIHGWRLTPSGTEGYRTAEVTRGGADVSEISSKTMQLNNHPRLFFIGEVLDVTGHLGGFNFQWAWSSGYVAGVNI
jgi:predicted Rossmann fold flavoprotein